MMSQYIKKPEQAPPIQTCPVCFRMPLPIYPHDVARTTQIHNNVNGCAELHPSAYREVVERLEALMPLGDIHAKDLWADDFDKAKQALTHARGGE